MTAIIAPQFLRDQSGAVSPRRSIAVILVGLLTLWLLFANFGHHVQLPESVLRKSSDKLLDTIQNSTLGFEKIIVINLKSRTDRRDGMALAGALTNLKLTFMDAATEVSEKSLPPNPPGDEDRTYGPAQLGCWRSHLNAARYIVENDISSALIMEDDADWDIRIHQQMTDLARATRLLVQPIPGSKDKYLDPTIGNNPQGQTPQTFIAGQHEVTPPTTSPYGDIDRWDLLWTGHCGSSLLDGNENIPIGRAIVLNETTVPEPHHINYEFTRDDSFKNEYPAHTRVVFRPAEVVCTLSYALTQQGARKVLYQLGIRQMVGTADNGLSGFCTGWDGQPLPTCLSAQPQYFQHHRPAGNVSFMTDISDPWGMDINPVANTANIRTSARVNLPKLVQGRTDFEDMYKDGE